MAALNATRSLEEAINGEPGVPACHHQSQTKWDVDSTLAQPWASARDCSECWRAREVSQQTDRRGEKSSAPFFTAANYHLVIVCSWRILAATPSPPIHYNPKWRVMDEDAENVSPAARLPVVSAGPNSPRLFVRNLPRKNSRVGQWHRADRHGSCRFGALGPQQARNVQPMLI